MSDNPTPYLEFTGKPLILRDWLAMDRTVLANERTLLAYIRTALAFLIVGGTLIKFLDSRAMAVCGYGCIVFAFALGLLGVLRFRQINQRIGAVRNGRQP